MKSKRILLIIILFFGFIITPVYASAVTTYMDELPWYKVQITLPNSYTINCRVYISFEDNGKLYYYNTTQTVVNYSDDTINAKGYIEELMTFVDITFNSMERGCYINSESLGMDNYYLEYAEVLETYNHFKWYSPVNNLNIGEYCLILVLVICAINLFIK